MGLQKTLQRKVEQGEIGAMEGKTGRKAIQYYVANSVQG